MTYLTQDAHGQPEHPATQLRPGEHPEEEEHEVGVGTEMHGAVYIICGLSYAWIMFMAWLAFGGNAGAAFDLNFASLVLAVMMGLPLIVYAVAHSHLKKKQPAWDEFFANPVQTATGSMKGWQAGLEIAIIPMVLALFATLIGVVWMLTPAGGASPG